MASVTHSLPEIGCSALTRTFQEGAMACVDVSFTVEPGEIVSLVGPSGCGKSTVLRLLAGLDLPTSGTTTLDRSSLGVVLQDPTLLPWRTVLDNVGLLGEISGVGRVERINEARNALRRVGLLEHSTKYPHELSGGMKMRAAVARCLTTGARTFLFDEPFSAIDELTRHDLDRDLLRLHEETPFTGLFITHSISEAVFLSHRVMVMSPAPGTIVADIEVTTPGPRHEVDRYHPALVDAEQRVHRALRGQLQ